MDIVAFYVCIFQTYTDNARSVDRNPLFFPAMLAIAVFSGSHRARFLEDDI